MTGSYDTAASTITNDVNVAWGFGLTLLAWLLSIIAAVVLSVLWKKGCASCNRPSRYSGRYGSYYAGQSSQTSQIDYSQQKQIELQQMQMSQAQQMQAQQQMQQDQQNTGAVMTVASENHNLFNVYTQGANPNDASAQSYSNGQNYPYQSQTPSTNYASATTYQQSLNPTSTNMNPNIASYQEPIPVYNDPPYLNQAASLNHSMSVNQAYNMPSQMDLNYAAQPMPMQQGIDMSAQPLGSNELAELQAQMMMNGLHDQY